MKIIVFFRIALKYLWRYRRRYLFLFLALGFGFGVLTVVSSLKDGMKENLYLSAQSHYAGDIIAIAGDYMNKNQQDIIFTSAETAGMETVSTAVRTSLHGSAAGNLFYNGMNVILKYVVGVDWEQEKNYFGELNYSESPALLNDTSILLSRPIADELMLRQGDSIILEILTKTSQKNTGAFIVAGIIEDSNFFSYYKVYISRPALNRLIGLNDEDCSMVGFFLKDRKNTENRRKALNTELSKRTETGPLLYDKDSYLDERKVDGNETIILLITLPVYLSEVAQLIGAIDLASYVLFAMMLVIILVSAKVTSSLILHERTRETATMRAIGFYESNLRFVLQLEIAVMAIASMAAGFILALLINRLLSYSSFDWFPGIEVFMQNGRLMARYLFSTLVVNIILTSCALILAIAGPLYRNSRGSLPEMLSGGST